MTPAFQLAPQPKADTILIGLFALVVLVLALLPLFGSALVIDKLTFLMVLVIMAVMWNLLAGYAGLISVGQQAFIGLGGYFMLRLVEGGMHPFLAVVLAAPLIVIVAWPMSWFVLRLKPAEFAVAMWVIAETIRSVIMFDPLVQGETGRSLVALNAIDPDLRRNTIFLMALAAAVASLVFSFILLNGRLGSESQAIRDDEEAAASLGVSTMRVKRVVFIVSAVGCGLAGTLWLASAITFQPRTSFGINWSIFMLFMVLVGGLGSFIGPVLGAVLFFALQEFFGDFGAWYLAGIGVVAMLFALYAPRGIVGIMSHKSQHNALSLRKTLLG